MSSQPEPPQSHDFDFWVGEWDVFGPKGAQVGTNSVTALFGTGAIAEHWHGAGDIEGRSLNAFDRSRACWHQTWVDSSGGLLLLDGGLSDGAMVMEGVAPAEEDAARLERQRITWTPGGDGSEVRQLWEVSADDGATWQVAFDGRYRRRGIAGPENM
jgi:hypothetical protein